VNRPRIERIGQIRTDQIRSNPSDPFNRWYIHTTIPYWRDAFAERSARAFATISLISFISVGP